MKELDSENDTFTDLETFPSGQTNSQRAVQCRLKRHERKCWNSWTNL
jgi:hypothetical protein